MIPIQQAQLFGSENKAFLREFSSPKENWGMAENPRGFSSVWGRGWSSKSLGIRKSPNMPPKVEATLCRSLHFPGPQFPHL